MLHHIAKCPQCARQFRVDMLMSGKKFHCYCGEVVVVQGASKGLEAKVVRCSSCGAPREGASMFCSSCNSDFTIHEKDMHTVCPSCSARVSDRARFCHHCGVKIEPDYFSEKISKLICPVCDGQKALHSRTLSNEAVSFFECMYCAGLWLAKSSFVQLIQSAQEKTVQDVLGNFISKSQSKTGFDPQESSPGRFYRKCPQCAEVMIRDNFGKVSGVIIDICKTHGIWFDVNELAHILQWIREGGLAKIRENEAYEARQQELRKASDLMWKEGAKLREKYQSGSGLSYGKDSLFSIFFDGLYDILTE